uniref:Uncharacterized protein n=1 Tax=Acrobeloides nanus TaxID=290746 RepID=A0A914BWT4_9BILA
MYHRLEHYQERIPDFWLENEPRPHVHGDMGPNADQLHRHYSKYEDYATSEFITDPPSNEESDKASPIGQDTNEYEKWSRAKALSPSETLSLKQTPLDPFDFFPDNPFGFENETGFGFGQDDIGLEEFQGKVRDNVEAEEDPFKNIATRKPTTEISSDKNVEKTLDLFEKEKAEISRPQEGFIPEEFPPGGDSDLLGKNRPNEPFPDLTKGDRIDEATLEDFRKLPDGLSRTGSSDESDSSNCCPCCKKGRKKSRCNDDEKGCINPFVRPHHPHVFGQPPGPCCAEAQPPAPCCPQLPTCCPTPLPCCPPLEPIRCCPSFSTCCEPGVGFKLVCLLFLS